MCLFDNGFLLPISSHYDGRKTSKSKWVGEKIETNGGDLDAGRDLTHNRDLAKSLELES